MELGRFGGGCCSFECLVLKFAGDCCDFESLVLKLRRLVRRAVSWFTVSFSSTLTLSTSASRSSNESMRLEIFLKLGASCRKSVKVNGRENKQQGFHQFSD